jgi:hypothetical protein
MTCVTTVTTNKYICKDSNNNYIFGDRLPTPIKHISKDTAKKEISLTTDSSNHYFTMDEKAHCSEKWQDWFCIQNYHNGNGVNKYPNTKTLSVGVCYNSCPKGYIKSANSKSNKCIIYYNDDDLIYNPLAIIAMLGTLLKNKDDKTKTLTIPKYTTINDTIGIRGSYLNDLYRLNIKEGTSISIADIEYINGTIPEEHPKQQKLLLKIIQHLVAKDNNTINAIKRDIENTSKELYDIYITRLKGDEEEKDRLLNRIKNYVFDMEKLKKLYDKNKNNNQNQRFQNIILYTYNIMRFVFYDNVADTTNPYESEKINTYIGELLDYNSLAKGDEEGKSFLIKIFKYACYNCFNVNFEIFDKYIKKNGITANTEICIINNTPIYTKKQRKDFVKFEMKDETDFLESSIDPLFIYKYPYYNDISFYDHQLLHEYSENTQYVTKILIILGVILGLIAAVCLFYYLFRKISYLTGIDMIKKVINFVNYCFLFYNSGTFALIKLFAFVYYYLIYNWGKTSYTIVSVFFKILNISILIVLTVIAFILILELLNMDYVSLLKKMNYLNNTDRGDVEIEDGKMLNLIKYVVSLYLIGVYMYCIYIIRFSINEDEYNILGNVDTPGEIGVRYIDTLLLKKYIKNITSSFNFMFTTDEMKWAVSIVGKPTMAVTASAGAPGAVAGVTGAVAGAPGASAGVTGAVTGVATGAVAGVTGAVADVATGAVAGVTGAVAGVTGAVADGDVATNTRAGIDALGALSDRVGDGTGADAVSVLADTASRQLGDATVEEMLGNFRTSPSSSPRGRGLSRVQPLSFPRFDTQNLITGPDGFVRYK